MIRKILRIIRVFVNRFRFGSFGDGSSIRHPLRINGAKNIYIGNNVGIHKQVWLGARNRTGNTPLLKIGDGTNIGDFAHIFATKSIIIGNDVLLANFVYISDNLHGFENPEVPIIKQPIVQKDEVNIGDGSWLGEHVCVIGASVGKHCVIGANSVVTQNIPDYCIAVGAPARIIKRYDFEAKEWKKTLSNGEFI